ncbi:MAG: hypothetical protein ACLTML_00680 [Blautia faecis]
MAKVPAKVPSPKRKVAVSARIKAGKERRIWITILSIRRITAGNPKFAAPKGESTRAKKGAKYRSGNRHLNGVKKAVAGSSEYKKNLAGSYPRPGR